MHLPSLFTVAANSLPSGARARRFIIPGSVPVVFPVVVCLCLFIFGWASFLTGNSQEASFFFNTPATHPSWGGQCTGGGGIAGTSGVASLFTV